MTLPSSALADPSYTPFPWNGMKNRTRLTLAVNLIVAMATAAPLFAQGSKSAVTVTPQKFELQGRVQQQVIVTGMKNGRPIDLTRDAKYRSATPKIVTVDEHGLITAVGDGEGRIVVSHGNSQTLATVRVTGIAETTPIDFERDVVPVLSRFACNSGSCHGKAGGQNGFQLSLFGFDPDFDFDSLSKENRGRRVFLPEPERSLLLRKPTGLVPHGGGKRLELGGSGYEVLRRWIVSGVPRRQPDAASLVSVRVNPSERIMDSNTQQQLIVTAVYSDGSEWDVTRLAAFQSSESAIAAVDENGLVKTSKIPGESAVMARYMGKIAVSNIAVPLKGNVPAEFYAKLPRYNFIDEHIWNKLARLGMTPSEPAGDQKYLRRAYIDVIGRLPTPDECRAFLKNADPKKREKLIDQLLERPEYADFWANKWVDLLRPNAYRVGIKTVLNYDFWIRDSFRKNKPYDQFVRELVAAKGSTFRNGAVTLFRDRRDPAERTTIISQLFLGIRLECAKCHHHPFEVWGQDDFYGFAAYFARVGRKGTGLSPPISGSEEMFFNTTTGSVKHPRTGKLMEPRPLFGSARDVTPETDPRDVLAEWMTSGQNPYFAQVMVNRVWADMMGRGIVMPVDDLRATNPPSNKELLTALGEDFRDQGFDIKKLIRRITSSYVYGLSSLPSNRNSVDTRNYSRHYRQRLRAEVLLDGVVDITGVPEKFAAMPPGSRAAEIWTHRIGSLFLDSFGRPDPNQDPPCERTGETTVSQVLHLMNSRNLYKKVTSNTGRVAQLAAGSKTPTEIVEELYLLVYARFPEPEELEITQKLFEKKEISRRQTTEDLLWALLNTPEFIFKD